MKVLFAVQDFPISPNSYGGGPALFYSHLELLAAGGHTIRLATIGNSTDDKGFAAYQEKDPSWLRVRGWIGGFVSIKYTPTFPRIVRRMLQAIFDPVAFTNSVVNKDVQREFCKVIDDFLPDLIWADDRMAMALVASIRTRIPVVYGHLDWGWRILKLRGKAGGMVGRFRCYQMRRAERKLVTVAVACVSGSEVECREIRKEGGRRVGYFPTTYDARPVSITKRDCAHLPRLIHLGGMKTTATRVGLSRFLEDVWPKVLSMIPELELHVVGSMMGCEEALLRRLRSENITIHGYIENLSEVLKPGDVQIIPWEHATGTRTRIPIALSFGQIIVASKNGVACSSELRHGANCLLVDVLPAMTKEIEMLCNDRDLRFKLAHNARATFLKSFTREALQASFDSFLVSIRSPKRCMD